MQPRALICSMVLTSVLLLLGVALFKMHMSANILHRQTWLLLSSQRLADRPQSRLSNCSSSFTEHPTASTVLFSDNKTEDVVRDCITGTVIGVRPKLVATVDVRQLLVHNHGELDQHRKAMFKKIFDARVWGRNPKVDFSASGMSKIYT